MIIRGDGNPKSLGQLHADCIFIHIRHPDDLYQRIVVEDLNQVGASSSCADNGDFREGSLGQGFWQKAHGWPFLGLKTRAARGARVMFKEKGRS